MPPINAVSHLGMQHSVAYWTRWAAGFLYCVDNNVDPTPLLELLVPSGQVIPTPVIYRAQLTSPLSENYIFARLPGLGVVAGFGGTLSQADLVRQMNSVRLVNVQVGGGSNYQTSQIWAQQSELFYGLLSDWLSQQSGFSLAAERVFLVGFSLGGVVAVGVFAHLYRSAPQPPLELSYLTIAMPPPWRTWTELIPIWNGHIIWREGDIVPSLYPHLIFAIQRGLMQRAIVAETIAMGEFKIFEHPGPTWRLSNGMVTRQSPPEVTTQQIAAAAQGTLAAADEHSLARYLREAAVSDLGTADVATDFISEFNLSLALRRVVPSYADAFSRQMPVLVMPGGGGTWEEAPPGMVLGEDFLSFLRDP